MGKTAGTRPPNDWTLNQCRTENYNSRPLVKAQCKKLEEQDAARIGRELAEKEIRDADADKLRKAQLQLKMTEDLKQEAERTRQFQLDAAKLNQPVLLARQQQQSEFQKILVFAGVGVVATLGIYFLIR